MIGYFLCPAFSFNVSQWLLYKPKFGYSVAIWWFSGGYHSTSMRMNRECKDQITGEWEQRLV